MRAKCGVARTARHSSDEICVISADESALLFTVLLSMWKLVVTGPAIEEPAGLQIHLCRSDWESCFHGAECSQRPSKLWSRLKAKMDEIALRLRRPKTVQVEAGVTASASLLRSVLMLRLPSSVWLAHLWKGGLAGRT